MKQIGFLLAVTEVTEWNFKRFPEASRVSFKIITADKKEWFFKALYIGFFPRVRGGGAHALHIEPEGELKAGFVLSFNTHPDFLEGKELAVKIINQALDSHLKNEEELNKRAKNNHLFWAA